MSDIRKLLSNSCHWLKFGKWSAITAFLAISLSFLINYRDTFHKSFYPWDVVTRTDPLYSARLVNSVRGPYDSILADGSQTLYYAGGGTPHGMAYLFGFDDRPMVSAIQSGRFHYIALAYRPTIDVLTAIQHSGYRRIGPA